MDAWSGWVQKELRDEAKMKSMITKMMKQAGM
jgi:hypothetical protein